VAYAILLFGFCDEVSADIKTRYATVLNN
jgi:hypothetical protein